jgi:2-haloacid dehalogenase
MPARVVIFDLGGVLIDWDPRYLYRKLIADEATMEDFLARVCTNQWNELQDAGRPLADATAQLVAEHPECAELITAYYERWEEMVMGGFEESVRVLEDLHRGGVPLYALSNFAAETFCRVRAQLPFLALFRDVVLSADHGLCKPDPRLYRVLLDRHSIDPTEAVFVDDRPPNVEAARALGMTGVDFRGADALRAELVGLGLLPR